MIDDRPAKTSPVDFLVIGAMKAGTTTLWNYLAEDEHIFMCQPKEPEFFTLNWDRGQEWYAGLFRNRTGSRLAGEASTSYTRVHRYPFAASRAATLAPNLRLIYMLRDPFERLVSTYRHVLLTGRDSGPLSAVLDRNWDLLVGQSLYAVQLAPWLARFPRRQLLLLDFDELVRSPQDVLNRVADHLGIPRRSISETHHDNDSSTRPAMAGWATKALDRFPAFRPVIQRGPARLRRSIGRLARRGGDVEATFDLSDAALLALHREFAEDLARIPELRTDRSEFSWHERY